VLQAALDAFRCYLIAERGRAYLSDARSLPDHAATTTVR
jgi:hypothetical protein